MEEKLLLEILKTLERGNSFGRETVKDEVLAMQSFSLVTEAEYISAWDKLIENKCVVEFRNQQKNNVREYKLNQSKNCIDVYTEKIKQIEDAATPKKEKPKWLTFNFYWEELIKYWFILLIAAIGGGILILIKQCGGKAKSLDKTSQTHQPVQVNTTKRKDILPQ